ncbi:unnamed protein product, partial [Brassica oleracea var. botrytis]
DSLIPFNGKVGTLRLGEIDVAFLTCYWLGMYFAGHWGDTLDLRLFLTWEWILCGVIILGWGYFLEHSCVLVLCGDANGG